MRSLPTMLLVLSFPAGAIAYVVAARVFSEMSLPEGIRDIVILFAPLFVAGLVMLPFLIPFFDRKAKADLADYRRQTASTDGADREQEAGPDDGEA
jgi:hypothetical protein